MQAIRVVLADDHPVVRTGIRTFLEQAADIEVLAEAEDGKAALRLAEELEPDVLLLDMELPGITGVEVTRRLQAAGSLVRVLALSAYDDEQYVFGLLDAGAAGYLLKDEALEAIVAAVRGVARGEGGWFSRQVAEKVVAWARGERAAPPGVARLTEREVEVLRLLARGWDNRRIAETLCIGEQTVKNHVSRIYAKLGVESRVEAVIRAISLGLVPFGEMQGQV